MWVQVPTEVRGDVRSPASGGTGGLLCARDRTLVLYEQPALLTAAPPCGIFYNLGVCVEEGIKQDSEGSGFGLDPRKCCVMWRNEIRIFIC